MGKPFPRTQVGGVSLPRMIIGCNWISGFSHTSSSCDNMIKSTHSCPETTAKIFEKFLDADIDAVLVHSDEDLDVLQHLFQSFLIQREI